jgi:hypothetical protein
MMRRDGERVEDESRAVKISVEEWRREGHEDDEDGWTQEERRKRTKRKIYLGDFTLHDKEVRVVDVQLDGLEEGLDSLLLGLVPVQQVLGYVRDGDLETSSVSLVLIFFSIKNVKRKVGKSDTGGRLSTDEEEMVRRVKRTHAPAE